MSKTGIDFVIGGKDQAKPAMESVEKSMRRLETGTDRLQTATKGLMASMGPLLGVLAAVKAAMMAVDGLRASSDAYDQQIASVKGLEVALRLQGASVELESARLQKYASDMQVLTGVGDEVTLGLMRQSSMLGISTDQLDDAAKAAIGLSEATGKNLDESLRLVNNALEGEFGAFGRVIPAIKSMTTEEEKLAAVMELAGKGLEAKIEASNTVAGMSERASGAIGDMMESVGALLAPVRILVSAGLKVLAESLQQVLVPAVDYANEVLANIGPLMDWVKEKVVAGVNAIVSAFTFFEVVLTNLDSVWALVVAQAELYMIQLVETIKHALTEVIPTYAKWFASNFVNLITDGITGAYHVVVNGIAALMDAFEALWDFIASGGETDIMERLGEISGRSYLDGFQSSLEALPEIASRTLTVREKQLTETIGSIGANLGDQFAEKFQSRMVKLGGGLTDEFSRKLELSVRDKVDDAVDSAMGNDPLKNGSGSTLGGASINATQSRLLTRGPASSFQSALDKMTTLLQTSVTIEKETANSIRDTSVLQKDMTGELIEIRKNTTDTVLMVPTL